jgi:hypothetical protein
MNKLNYQETFEKLLDEEIPGTMSALKEASNETISAENIHAEPDIELSKEREVSGYSISDFPEIMRGSKVSINEIKFLNRKITKRIPRDVKDEFIKEHIILVKNKFDKGLSKAEERRLSYVRWQLDRIDDAEHGEYLDRLEGFTEGIETFAVEIDKLLKQFEPPKRKPGFSKR